MPLATHARTGKQEAARRLVRATVRSLPLAATLTVHLIVLLMLTRPGEPRERLGRADEPPTDALKIRWIVPPPPLRAIPPPPTAPSRAGARSARDHRPEAVPLPPPASAPEHAALRALRLTLPARAAADYVPGGGALGEGLDTAHRLPRLPGQAAVPHAPVFRMIDPRRQGVAGLLHLLGSLTGAVDPKCIQLDKWQRMSLQERDANHVTDKAMADIEREHGCIPPPARVGPGSNPLTGP